MRKLYKFAWWFSGIDIPNYIIRFHAITVYVSNKTTMDALNGQGVGGLTM